MRPVQKNEWTNRQEMPEQVTFEFHHYLDTEPVEVDFHEHPFYEMFFFLDGDVDYTIEGKLYRLRPGDVLLTNSLDIHRAEVRPGSPYERVVVWLEDRFFDPFRTQGADLAVIFADAARKDYRLIRPEESRFIRMRTLCEQIDHVQSQGKYGDDVGNGALVYAYLIELLVEVCRCYYDRPEDLRTDVTENEKVNEVLRYINENIRGSLSLDRIAGALYLSKYYLSRLFRKFTGISIYQYVIKKRLTIARDLLRAGRSVTEACEECGFGDYSNFLKAFRREFGQSPSEVRNQSIKS